MADAPQRPNVPGSGTTGPVVEGLYQLAEPDYKFGLGPLLARITRVIGPVEFGEDGKTETWWQVEAVCAVRGHAGPGQPRSLYVRAGCLAASRRISHG